MVGACPLYRRPGRRFPSRGRESHQARELAESFGSDAERYDRARPRYPGPWWTGSSPPAPGPGLCLDVGCGTGIAARQFQAAGCRVLGVDPDARMAELARRRGLEVEVAMFEAWDSGGREFDAVVAGQAWHWVDPVAGAAKAAEVLRPGGRLAVFWNVFQPPPDLAEAFAAVYRRVLPDSPLLRGGADDRGLDAYPGLFAKAADGMRQAGAFGDAGAVAVRLGPAATPGTNGWTRCRPSAASGQIPEDGQREICWRAFGAAIDAAGGSFTVQYATVAVAAARASAA